MNKDDRVEVALVRDQDAIENAREQGSQILEAFEDFEIESAEDFELAADCLKDIKKTAKEIKAEKELATKPMNAALRQVRSWFAPAEAVLTNTEKLLKSKISDWTLLQERKAREAMEKAATASRSGDFDAAHEAAKGIVERPRAKGVTVSMPGWDYVVEDLDRVPRQYLSLDHSAVKTHLRAAGSEEPEAIPGLRFVRATPTVTARTK